MNDEVLWSKITQGEPNALREIYDLHISDLENYCKKITQDVNLIEQSLYNVFVNIWQNRKTLRPGDSIVSYLFGSIRKELLGEIKNKILILPTVNEERKDVGFRITLEDILIQQENATIDPIELHKAFELLSHSEREAIYLRYYNEMTCEEISSIMDVDYKTVEEMLSKGVFSIREGIKND